VDDRTGGRLVATGFLMIAFAWLIAVCLALAHEIAPPTGLRERLQSAVGTARDSPTHALDLVGASRLAWSKLMIFDEKTPAAHVRSVVARGWPGEHLEEGAVPANTTLLVFADDTSVVGSVAIPESVVDFDCLGATAEPSDLLVEILRPNAAPAVARESEQAKCGQ
jgi:hypothetical protein